MQSACLSASSRQASQTYSASPIVWLGPSGRIQNRCLACCLPLLRMQGQIAVGLRAMALAEGPIRAGTLVQPAQHAARESKAQGGSAPCCSCRLNASIWASIEDKRAWSLVPGAGLRASNSAPSSLKAANLSAKSCRLLERSDIWFSSIFFEKLTLPIYLMKSIRRYKNYITKRFPLTECPCQRIELFRRARSRLPRLCQDHSHAASTPHLRSSPV